MFLAKWHKTQMLQLIHFKLTNNAVNWKFFLMSATDDYILLRYDYFPWYSECKYFMHFNHNGLNWAAGPEDKNLGR